MCPIRIAIVGAGPVGLMLARLLVDKPNIEVVIFESDKSRDFRSLAALKEAGLYDEFLKRARFDGEALIICDKKLIKYVQLPGVKEGSSRGRPEIDRTALREMLLDSVPSQMIRWGYHLRSIDEDRNLIFDQGTEGGFDLVVGADGAWSKIRKLVSDQNPDYSGVSGFGFIIPDAEKTAPQCYKLTNRGSIFSYSDGRSIMSQQIGDGSLNIYCWSTWPEDWRNKVPYDMQNPDAIKQALMEEFHDWHPQLVDFLQYLREPVARSLYMLPVGWSWGNRPGVTLIGDAAHVMTPFAGEGVNLGMQDAQMLSRVIIKASHSPTPNTQLQSEIKTFEKDLFVRAERTASLTNDMLRWNFLSDGAPRSVIEKVALRRMTFHDGPVKRLFKLPLLAAAIYSFYFVFKLCHR